VSWRDKSISRRCAYRVLILRVTSITNPNKGLGGPIRASEAALSGVRQQGLYPRPRSCRVFRGVFPQDPSATASPRIRVMRDEQKQLLQSGFIRRAEYANPPEWLADCGDLKTRSPLFVKPDPPIVTSRVSFEEILLTLRLRSSAAHRAIRVKRRRRKGQVTWLWHLLGQLTQRAMAAEHDVGLRKGIPFNERPLRMVLEFAPGGVRSAASGLGKRCAFGRRISLEELLLRAMRPVMIFPRSARARLGNHDAS